MDGTQAVVRRTVNEATASEHSMRGTHRDRLQREKDYANSLSQYLSHAYIKMAANGLYFCRDTCDTSKPPATKCRPITIVSPDRMHQPVSLRWLPEPPFENTETLVLTVGEWYVDLRVDKESGTLDWAIAGQCLLKDVNPRMSRFRSFNCN